MKDIYWLVVLDNQDNFNACLDQFNAIIKNEYVTTDPQLGLVYQINDETSVSALTKTSTSQVVFMLRNLPSGIQRMSFDIEGLVQTSLNLGILKTLDNEVSASFAVRSSVSSEKEELVDRLVSLMDCIGGSVDCMGDYPAWQYQQESPLRDLMTEVFEEQYGKKPVIQALHAGVECGLFAGRLDGLDCVSFGPDMTDIHTFNETLNVESAARTWNYLLEVLKRLK